MPGRARVRRLRCVVLVNVISPILLWIGRIKMDKSEISNVTIIWQNSLRENSQKTVILV